MRLLCVPSVATINNCCLCSSRTCQMLSMWMWRLVNAPLHVAGVSGDRQLDKRGNGVRFTASNKPPRFCYNTRRCVGYSYGREKSMGPRHKTGLHARGLGLWMHRHQRCTGCWESGRKWKGKTRTVAEQATRTDSIASPRRFCVFCVHCTGNSQDTSRGHWGLCALLADFRMPLKRGSMVRASWSRCRAKCW